MKRFISIMLSAVIVLGMVGCGAQNGTPTESPTKAAETNSPEATQTAALSGEITGEITVSCYETMTYKNFLDAAVAAFEEKYPGTKVNVNTFSAMPEIRTSTSSEGGGRTMAVMMMDNTEDTKAQSDYMTQINTEMISGGGPDIIAADILPYYKYALNGQLEDLQVYMNSDPDFNLSDYRSNIFEAAKFNGGQYILPLDYSFNVLSYDSTLMEEEAQSSFSVDGKYTYEQLVEIGLDSYTKNYNADAESPLKMFNLYSDVRDIDNSFAGNVFNANYNTFVDIVNKNANFTDGKFAGLLNQAKEYEEKGYLNSRLNTNMGQMDAANMREMMRQASSQSYLYKSTSNMMLLQAFNTEDTTRINRAFTIGGGGGITENDTLAGMQSNEKGEVAFSVSQAYTMNANSKNKRTAWEFIKFLLNEEMQTTFYLQGVPVNIAASEEKAKQQITGELYAAAGIVFRGARNVEGDQNAAPQENAVQENVPGNEADATPKEGELKTAPDGDGFSVNVGGEDIKIDFPSPEDFEGEVELTEAQQETLEKYMAAIETYTSMLNSYMIHDTTVDDMINKEVQTFFDGSRTAEEVASTLQNKIDMYLKE